MNTRKRKAPILMVTPQRQTPHGDSEEETSEDEMEVHHLDEDFRQGADFAAAVVSGRVVSKTKVKYGYLFNNITSFCRAHYRGSTHPNGDLVLPMSFNHLKAFFGDRFREREDGTLISFSHVNSYCSALKYFYKERNLRMAEDACEYLSQFCDGYKRLVADKKAQGIMKNFEGKVPVAYLIYMQLAKQALFAAEKRTPYSSYVHCFMLLSWNLFARSCSVGDLKLNHFSWQNDSLVIDMSKQKADQTGERIVPKHLYANPYNPEICVILGLALHVFAVSFRMDNENRSSVFAGTPYSLFSKWLQNALDNIQNLGNEAKDYGTHSFRKGIATYCSGFIGGPSVIAIFLRAGWSLGQVQDRYITYSDGGDQFCGRISAGLNYNGGSQFAVLPPHFNITNNNVVLTREEWLLICPRYEQYPITFQSCIPYLLASLVYHHDWWSAKDEAGEYINISKYHPIHQSRVVTSGLLQRLKSQLSAINTSGRCSVTGMTATGIPMHVDLLREIEVLKMENSALKQQFQQHHTILMEELPRKVTENILANCNVEGVQQISRNEFDCALDRLYDRINTNITSNIRQLQPIVESIPAVDDTVRNDTWNWGGKMNLPVPEEWSFPKGTTKTVCDLFITGIPWSDNKRIRPFQLIRVSLLHRKDQSAFTKAEKVFTMIKNKSIENNFFRGTLAEFRTISIPLWDRVFSETYTHLIALVSAKRQKAIPKAAELSIITFYDMLNELSN